jgi:signal transduction histidine kinase
VLSAYSGKVVEHSREGVALISLGDFTIRDVNRAMTEILGLPREQIMGRPCHDVFHHVFTPCAARNCPVAKMQGGEFICESAHVHGGEGAPGLRIRAVRVDEGHGLYFCLPRTDLFRDAEELEALEYITSLVHRTLSVDQVIHTILTAVTAHHGLGFHRAFLFQYDQREDTLVGSYAVGPSSAEEAFRIWSGIQDKHLSLMDLLKERNTAEAERSPLQQVVRSIRLPLARSRDVLVWAFLQGINVNLTTDTLPPDLAYDSLDLFGAGRSILIPLHSPISPVGLLAADDAFSGRPIEEARVKSLAIFASEASAALANSMMFENLLDKTQALQEAMDHLRESQEKLVLAERLSTVGQFSAQIAHEIRNPLVTIGRLARQLARSPGLAPDEHAKAEAVAMEESRMERLLNDLLDFSAQPKPRLEPTDLTAVLRSLLLFMGDEFIRRGIKVSTVIDPGVPACMADADQMRHVFLNLFRNAMNILQEGGEISVRVSAPDEETVRVSISDNGPGIPDGIRERIFAPFFTTSSVGTGLGLAVASRIISDHGGRITVDNVPGGGAVFHMDLKAFWEGRRAQ